MSLREAYELIKDEERWCQGQMAKTADGFGTDPHSPSAARWCALGALGKKGVTDEEQMVLARVTSALFPEMLASTAPGPLAHLVRVNDNLGHDAVTQAFEKAIVEVEGSL